MIDISTFLHVAGALLTRPFIALVIPRPRPVQSAVVQKCSSAVLHYISAVCIAGPHPPLHRAIVHPLYFAVQYCTIVQVQDMLGMQLNAFYFITLNIFIGQL